MTNYLFNQIQICLHKVASIKVSQAPAYLFSQIFVKKKLDGYIEIKKYNMTIFYNSVHVFRIQN